MWSVVNGNKKKMVVNGNRRRIMNKTYPLESYKFPTNGLNPLMLEVRPSQQNALESISEGQFFKKGEK
jgi:hypothetical protein